MYSINWKSYTLVFYTADLTIFVACSLASKSLNNRVSFREGGGAFAPPLEIMQTR